MIVMVINLHSRIQFSTNFHKGSRQCTPARVYVRDSMTFCHATICHATSLSRDILSRDILARDIFSLRQFVTTTICHYDHLSLRQIVTTTICHATICHATFCHDDNLSLRQFVTTTICHYDNLSLRQFITPTVCHYDNLSLILYKKNPEPLRVSMPNIALCYDSAKPWAFKLTVQKSMAKH